MEDREIIIKPLLSEKSYAGIPNKRYTFVVKKNANKVQIRLAVERLFDVQVDRVNTLNCRGKLKKMGKTQGYTSNYKKAIVTLKKDSKTIAFFDSLS